MIMREYEFRGQDKDNNWVHGDLIHGVSYKKDNLYILPLQRQLAYIPNCDALDGVQVKNETVGQYIGLKDASKEKVKLYDKDIISDANGFKKVIYWEEEKSRFCLKNIIALKYEGTQYINQGVSQEYIDELGFVKVGNIFDNHELLNK